MCQNASKTTLQLISQLMWVVGLVVGIGGFYLYSKYIHASQLFSECYIILPAFVVLAGAALSLIIGFFGTWLSFQNSSCRQGLFVYLLVVSFCFQSTALALAYFRSLKLGADLAPLSDIFQNYNGSIQDPASKTVDAAQQEFECCGVHNYTDWLETAWFNQSGGVRIPHSCCNSIFASCTGSVDQPWLLYSQGCQENVEMSFHFLLNFILWGSLLVVLVGVILLLTMMHIMREPPPLFGYQVL